ncbi:MAG: hypothetical protein KatS3mg044_0319 [Rhodothermaceae bacterium]|nr:MAG: hypothetical protein KatS3mg044_0319 [Rhodothermaceae bacterium]
MHPSLIPTHLLAEGDREQSPYYLDMAGVLFLMLDAAGRVTRINARGCELLGRSMDEVVGEAWLERFVLAPDRDAVQAFFERIRRGDTEDSGYIEYRVAAADGEERIVAWNNVIVRDDAGEVVALLSTGTDVTPRRRAEEALRVSEERYRSLYNQTPAMLHSIDREGRILSVSDYWLEHMGYERDEVIGRPLTDFMDEASRERAIRETFPSFFEAGCCKDVPYRFVRKDGTVRDVLLSATAERDARGEIVRSLAVVEDVTERLRTEQALRASEARVRAILETTVDAIITIDTRGIIQSFNRAAERIFGYRADEVIGRSVNLLMPEPYRTEHDAYIQNYLETGQAKIIGIGREVYGRRKDGTTFPMDLAVSEVRLDVPGRDRPEITFTGIVRDITERRRLEQEILRISDQERVRIGQDLHDGLGQMLTGIGLITRNLVRRLAAEDHPLADELAEVADMIKEADLQARSLARGLVPVDLDEHGLAAALARLARNAERLFGITCTFEEVGSPVITESDVALHLYRIAQEAVSNAVKHGQAGTVRLYLVARDDQVVLRIQDDGQGFPETPLKEQGMGVRIMQYRARIINGLLEIHSGVDRGTVVTCTLTHPRHVSEPTPNLRV